MPDVEIRADGPVEDIAKECKKELARAKARGGGIGYQPPSDLYMEGWGLLSSDYEVEIYYSGEKMESIGFRR